MTICFQGFLRSLVAWYDSNHPRRMIDPYIVAPPRSNDCGNYGVDKLFSNRVCETAILESSSFRMSGW